MEISKNQLELSHKFLKIRKRVEALEKWVMRFSELFAKAEKHF
jgi:hypothetical protein